MSKIVSATGAQAAPLYSASQVLASTSNGINLGLSMQMYGGKIPDLATAQKKITKAGLPRLLAERLAMGR